MSTPAPTTATAKAQVAAAVHASLLQTLETDIANDASTAFTYFKAGLSVVATFAADLSPWGELGATLAGDPEIAAAIGVSDAGLQAANTAVQAGDVQGATTAVLSAVSSVKTAIAPPAAS